MGGCFVQTVMNVRYERVNQMVERINHPIPMAFSLSCSMPLAVDAMTTLLMIKLIHVSVDATAIYINNGAENRPEPTLSGELGGLKTRNRRACEEGHALNNPHWKRCTI